MIANFVSLKDESKILKFRDILPGILFFLRKLPKIVKPLREIQKWSEDEALSLGSVLEDNARKYPDGRAILFEDQCYTHSQFNEIVNRYANYLLSMGVKKGEVIIAFLENRPEILFLIGAVSKIGAIVSLINSNQRGSVGSVLLHSINVTPSRLFIIGEERIHTFEEIREDLKLDEQAKTFFLPDQGLSPAPEGHFDWHMETKDMDTGNPATTPEITLKDPFAFLFTSGTTGMPKAAITLHHRWVTPMYWFGKLMLTLGPKDTLYIPLPFYHGTAMYVGWPTAASGGAAVAMRRKFSASNFWKDVEKFKATGFVYIGELCRYLMQQQPRADDRKNTIKKIVGNGLRPDIWMEFKKRFNIPEIYEFYGSSEGNAAFGNMFNLNCTVGICPVPYAIVKYDIENEEPIKDEKGFLQKVEKGEAGLLLGQITDNSPFVGYTDPTATEKKIIRNVFEEGDAWYDAGDLLRDIGFGHAQFVDRLGDTFRWKGENVSTIEVESVINSFEQVLAPNVYGVSIPGADGRAGMASIITEDEMRDFDLQGFLESLQRGLPAYAIPRFIRFKAEFDTTETLKIKKFKLKKEGFDPRQVSDPLYVMMPGDSKYVPLTEEIYNEIINGQYSF